MAETGTVYLLHFDRPFSHACHYLGWAKPGSARIARHLMGKGSALTRAAYAAGVRFTLVATWEGTRADERKLKNRKNSRGLCPVCKPGYNKAAAAKMRKRRAS
jgi:hypothetical protein